MKPLSSEALLRLQAAAEYPDLTGTRYELGGKLGAGGMASVYLARDRTLDRPVALKVVHVPNEATTSRLLAEARVVAGLEHPGIVPVHDAGVLVDGRVYYAMKVVRGRRLDRLGPEVSRPERLRLFCQLCEAVAFAHSRGVIHRDLKPQNVMVGSFGEVLVMDWGIAKLRNSAQAASTGGPVIPGGTAHGTVLGTPGYMSPEQERGDGADERSDVFALGSLLAFLLTGRSPPIGPAAAWDTVPPALRAVVRRATADDPTVRYPGVPELAAEVGRFLLHRRVAAFREGWFDTGRRLAGRYRVAVGLVLAYLTVRLLFFFWAGV